LRAADTAGGCAFHFADLLVLPRLPLTLEGVDLLLRRPQLSLEAVVEFHDPEPLVWSDPLAFPSSHLPRLILSGRTNGGNCRRKI
jgi:hypothetical protein